MIENFDKLSKDFIGKLLLKLAEKDNASVALVTRVTYHEILH